MNKDSMRIFSTILLAGVACSAIAAERKLTAIPNGRHEIVIDRGHENVISRGSCTVILRTEPLSKKKAWFSLGIVNLTDSNQDFLDHQIVARSGGESLKIYLADEIIRAEKRSQMWEEILTGFAAGVNSYTASQQGHYTESGTVSGTVRDGTHRLRVSGTYRADMFDYRANQAAINAASEANAEAFRELEQRQTAELELLGEDLIYSQTIAAGETHSGRFQVQIPKRAQKRTQLITTSISVCGETHRFDYAVDGPVSDVQHLAPPAKTARPNTIATSPVEAEPSYSESPSLVTDAIIPSITSVYIRPQELPDGTTDEVVFFDVFWKSAEPPRGPVKGKLQLIDPAGKVHVAMAWTIPEGSFKNGQFEEVGVGFPAASFRGELEWLKQIHPPLITARFLPESSMGISPEPTGITAPTTSNQLQITHSELVLMESDQSGNPTVRRTRVVPRIDGQEYAYLIRVNRKIGRVKLREEITLPVAPPSWGEVPEGTTFSVSSDGRTATIEAYHNIDEDFLVRIFKLSAEQPAGTYVVRVFLDDAAPEVFEFQVR